MNIKRMIATGVIGGGAAVANTYTSDSFNRANGAIGNTDGAGDASYPNGFVTPWIGSTYAIATNKASNTPTKGAELIANGNFSAWTGDNPNSWTIIGESGTDPEVSEVGTGEGHGGAGTGRCNFYTSSGSLTLRQDPFAAGRWYRLDMVIDTVTSGGVRCNFGFNGINYTTVGAKVGAGRSTGTALQFVKTGNPSDVTLTSIGMKQLTLATLFSTIDLTVTDAICSAEVTQANPCPAGIVMNLDSDSSPANFVVIWHDGISVLYVDQCVAGTYTNLLSATPTNYAAGAVIQATRNADRTYTVKYNGVAKGTSTAANAGITGTRHGTFSTGDPADVQLDNFICRPSSFL